MKLRKYIIVVALSLLISACYNRPPQSVGWGYVTGDPVLYGYSPYYSGGYGYGYSHDYWNGYRGQSSYDQTNQVGIININAR